MGKDDENERRQSHFVGSVVDAADQVALNGGKHYLARRIVALMCPHIHYVEPFAGGLAVLLEKDPEGHSEVVNDLDGRLMNFWRVLQSPHHFDEFIRRVQATPFSEQEFHDAAHQVNWDPVESAVHFFIRCRQSLAGRMDTFAPLSRTRTRRGMNEQASAWLGAVGGLTAVHERLRRVVILNRSAIEVIRSQDGPETLFYCDPPYCHETRATTGEYAHEMTTAQHSELLDVLTGIKGKFLLSGYRSQMYDDFGVMRRWKRHEFEIPNNAAGGAVKRRMTECVWCNF